jgi:hypothetical protein
MQDQPGLNNSLFEHLIVDLFSDFALVSRITFFLNPLPASCRGTTQEESVACTKGMTFPSEGKSATIMS